MGAILLIHTLNNSKTRLVSEIIYDKFSKHFDGSFQFFYKRYKRLENIFNPLVKYSKVKNPICLINEAVDIANLLASICAYNPNDLDAMYSFIFCLADQIEMKDDIFLQLVTRFLVNYHKSGTRVAIPDGNYFPLKKN